MSSCSVYTSYQDCDTCQYKYDCKYYNIFDSDDKSEDPCNGCDVQKNTIIKDGYDIGPHWHCKG